MAGELAELRTIFGKSVVAVRDLPAGHVLVEADLAFKKPGTGIPAARWREVVGRKLVRPVVVDTLIGEADLG
jgi:sialic acid synthase SpsE